MYDAIVVGARCAGSPTAMLLARAGHRVLLVDRAGFPSDTLSTHYIHQPGVARLRRWGLLDRVVATGCPPARRMTFDVGPFALTGAPTPADGADAAYAPRRYLLDQILLEAASAAGAEVRERFSVGELLVEDGRVTGIRGRQAGGATVTERAAIVIGADGMRSRVARAVGAPTYHERPGRTCAYYTYWSGVPARRRRALPPRRAHGHRRPHQRRAHDRHGLLAAGRVPPRPGGHRAQLPRGGRRWRPPSPSACAPAGAPSASTAPASSRSSSAGRSAPAGRWWATPATTRTRSRRRASATPSATPSCSPARSTRASRGHRPLDDALADYERRRNEAALPLYDFTYELAGLEPPRPEMQALFVALRDDPEQTSRFFGVIAGTVPMAEFFARDDVAAGVA